jgi:hypothetical protein
MDCLPLLLRDSCGVQEMMIKNCEIVRIDGMDATITGEYCDNFMAYRDCPGKVPGGGAVFWN